MSPASYFIEATYLLASVFFVLGLKAMSHPDERAVNPKSFGVKPKLGA